MWLGPSYPNGLCAVLFPGEPKAQENYDRCRQENSQEEYSPAEKRHCQKGRQQGESSEADGRDWRTTGPAAVTGQKHDSCSDAAQRSNQQKEASDHVAGESRHGRKQEECAKHDANYAGCDP